MIGRGHGQALPEQGDMRPTAGGVHGVFGGKDRPWLQATASQADSAAGLRASIQRVGRGRQRLQAVLRGVGAQVDAGRIQIGDQWKAPTQPGAHEVGGINTFLVRQNQPQGIGGGQRVQAGLDHVFVCHRRAKGRVQRRCALVIADKGQVRVIDMVDDDILRRGVASDGLSRAAPILPPVCRVMRPQKRQRSQEHCQESSGQRAPRPWSPTPDCVQPACPGQAQGRNQEDEIARLGEDSGIFGLQEIA